MPLWMVYHPADAYTEEDKKGLAERITSLYAQVPIPKFYVVVVYQEVLAGNLYVAGERHDTLESIAEKRWVEENKAGPYGQAEKFPASMTLTAPGVTG